MDKVHAYLKWVRQSIGPFLWYWGRVILVLLMIAFFVLAGLYVGIFIYVGKQRVPLDTLLEKLNPSHEIVFSSSKIRWDHAFLRVGNEKMGKNNLFLFFPSLEISSTTQALKSGQEKQAVKESTRIAGRVQNIWIQPSILKFLRFGGVISNLRIESAHLNVTSMSPVLKDGLTKERELVWRIGVAKEQRLAKFSQQFFSFLRQRVFGVLLDTGIQSFRLEQLETTFSWNKGKGHVQAKTKDLFIGRKLSPDLFKVFTDQEEGDSPLEHSWVFRLFHPTIFLYTTSKGWMTYGAHTVAGQCEVWGAYYGRKGQLEGRSRCGKLQLSGGISSFLKERGVSSFVSPQIRGSASYDFFRQNGKLGVGIAAERVTIKPKGYTSHSFKELSLNDRWSFSLASTTKKQTEEVTSYHRLRLKGQMAPKQKRIFFGGEFYPLQSFEGDFLLDMAKDKITTKSFQLQLLPLSHSKNPDMPTPRAELDLEVTGMLESFWRPVLQSLPLNEQAVLPQSKIFLALRLFDLPISKMPLYWKSNLAPMAWEWSMTNMFFQHGKSKYTPSGMLKTASLHMLWKSREHSLFLESYGGHLALKGATVRYLPHAPVARDVDAIATYTQNHFVLSFSHGQTKDGLNLQKGTLDFDYHRHPHLSMMNLYLSLQGDMQAYAPVVGSLPRAPSYIESFLRKIKGPTDMMVHLQMPLKSKSLPVKFEGQFSLSKGSMRLKSQKLQLTRMEATGGVNLEKIWFEASGRGRRFQVGGEPMTFTIVGDEQLYGNDKNWKIHAKIPANQIVGSLSAVEAQRYFGLVGDVGAQVDWQQRKKEKKVFLSADLKNIGWRLPVFGEKQRSVPGHFDAQFGARENDPLILKKAALESPNLTFQLTQKSSKEEGYVSYETKGSLLGKTLKKMRLTVGYPSGIWTGDIQLPFSYDQMVGPYVGTVLSPEKQKTWEYIRSRLKKWQPWETKGVAFHFQYTKGKDFVLRSSLPSSKVEEEGVKMRYRFRPDDGFSEAIEPYPQWFFYSYLDDISPLTKLFDLSYFQEASGRLQLLYRPQGDWAGSLKLGGVRFKKIDLPFVVQFSRLFSIPLVSSNYPFDEADISFLLRENILDIGEVRLTGSSAVSFVGQYYFGENILKGYGVYVPLWHVNQITQILLPLKTFFNGGDSVGGVGATRFYVFGKDGDFKVTKKLASILTPFFLKELFFSSQKGMKELKHFSFDEEKGIR